MSAIVELRMTTNSPTTQPTPVKRGHYAEAIWALARLELDVEAYAKLEPLDRCIAFEEALMLGLRRHGLELLDVASEETKSGGKAWLITAAARRGERETFEAEITTPSRPRSIAVLDQLITKIARATQNTPGTT